MPVQVCDLLNQGGCGEAGGEAAGEVPPRFGRLGPCPRCGEPGGLIRCTACHGRLFA